MLLEGWNHLPAGYGAHFELSNAPWWLRAWFNVPFVDRFAYPVAVRRGFGVLTPSPGWPVEDRETPEPDWRISTYGDEAEGMSP
jgi:hypothetical protein